MSTFSIHNNLHPATTGTSENWFRIFYCYGTRRPTLKDETKSNFGVFKTPTAGTKRNRCPQRKPSNQRNRNCTSVTSRHRPKTVTQPARKSCPAIWPTRTTPNGISSTKQPFNTTGNQIPHATTKPNNGVARMCRKNPPKTLWIGQTVFKCDST